MTKKVSRMFPRLIAITVLTLCITTSVLGGTVVVTDTYGFDESDSTRFLQAALNSGAETVIIPNVGKDWITTPLILNSNQHVIFEPGVVVTARKGYFRGTHESLFFAEDQSNIRLTGYGATLKMQKADYDGPGYVKAEWRHALRFAGSSNVTIEGLTIRDTGGDGLYLGSEGRGYNDNFTVRDVVFDNNYRQGISIISAQNVLIEDSVFKNTSGTGPAAGIDLEPDNPPNRLVNIVVRNSVAENNDGPGFAVSPSGLDSTSLPISVLFDNVHVKSGNSHGLMVSGVKDNGPGGQITFRNTLVENTDGLGLRILDKSSTSARVKFENVTVRNVAGADPPDWWYSGVGWTPILFHLRSRNWSNHPGGVDFVNVMIEDNMDRPFIAYDALFGGAPGLFDVQGDITVTNPHGITTDLGLKLTNVNLTIRNGNPDPGPDPDPDPDPDPNPDPVNVGEWSWLNPGTTVNSGNARFTPDLTLETGMIINQFPGAVLIFQAPLDGDYSIKGKAKWDWSRTNHPDEGGTGIPNPNEMSQLRFDVRTWTPTDPNTPGTAVPNEFKNAGAIPLTSQSALGVVQASGTHTVDFSTLAALQDISMKEDDFLSIVSRNRGILSLESVPANLDTAVFDNQVMQLAFDPSDRVRIRGPGEVDLVGNLDGSGTVDVVDFGIFAGLFGGFDPSADFDGSGSVDIVDFGVFAASFGDDSATGIVNYLIPFWDNTQDDEFGGFTDRIGGRWFFGHSNQAGRLYIAGTPTGPSFTPPPDAPSSIPEPAMPALIGLLALWLLSQRRYSPRSIGPSHQPSPDPSSLRCSVAPSLSFCFLVLLPLLLHSPASAIDVDYVIPFWTGGPVTDNTGQSVGQGAVYKDGPFESTWHIGRSDQGGRLNVGPSFINPGPQFNAATNEWAYIDQTNPPSLKGINSGNARFNSNKELTTDGIWNQFPRPVLIFEAPAAGDYSFTGKVQWDWWATGTPAPGQFSQIRFEIESWEGHPWGPVLNFPNRTTHAHPGTPGMGIDQLSGTATVDLGTIPQLQNITLDAGDYLGIRSGNRGVLNGSNPNLNVFDNSRMQMNVDPSDPMRIRGPLANGASAASVEEVESDDLDALLAAMGTMRGNLNPQGGVFDGQVDIVDFGVVAGSFGTLHPHTYLNGDLNKDGQVDIIDFGMLAANFGVGSSPSIVSPEPAALAILGMSGLVILCRRR